MELNFKIERFKKNMTQDELSNLSGVSRITIHKIETKGIDGVRVGILKKIAKALDSTVQELFFSDEE